MTIHYSGMTIEAQQRIADGVREILATHLEGAPPPEDYVVGAPES
jgi:formate dehydrogenase